MKMLLARSAVATGSPLARRASTATTSEGARRFSLPDMTEREKRFVDDQVEAVMRPSFLGGRKVTDVNGENGKPVVDLGSPVDFHALYPRAADFEAMRSCVEVVRNNGYPDFKLDISCHDPFKRNLMYPLITERAVRALRTFGVKGPSLDQMPRSLYMSSTYKDAPTLYRKVQIYDYQHPMDEIRHGGTRIILRGKQLLNFVRKTERTLETLGLEEIAHKFKRKVVAKFQDSAAVDYEKIKTFCLTNVAVEIAKREGLEDIGKVLKKKYPVNLDSVDVARNHYILKNIVGLKHSLIFPYLFNSPLELLVTLRVNFELYESLDQNVTIDSFVGDFCWSHGGKAEMKNPCAKLPSPYKALYLLHMGFSKKEVLEILKSRAGIDFKAQADPGSGFKHHELSRPDYLGVMRNRLRILRSDEDTLNFGVLMASDHFHFIKNWTDNVNVIGFKGHGHLNNSDLKSKKLKTAFTYNSPIARILTDYFGAGRLKVKEIRNRVDPINMKPADVLANLSFLEEMGFTKDQIFDSLEILAYPTSIVVQGLAEIDQSEPHRLNLALFTLDRLNGFSKCRCFADEKSISTPETSTSDDAEREDDDDDHDEFERGYFSEHSHRMPVRLFSTYSSTRDMSTKSFKRSILPYLQNPFKYVETELKFQKLRRDLDPDLRRDDIVRGAKVAVSTVTRMISENRFDELKGLLTLRERERVQREVETVWPDTWRNCIAIMPEEVDIVIIENVRHHTMVDKSFLDIFMKLLCLIDHRKPRVALGINTTLSREYKEGSLKDWTMTNFKVIFCKPV